MSYARKDPTMTTGYAKHLTPEAEAWLAARHNPRFKPDPLPRLTLTLRRLTEKQRAKLFAEFNVKEIHA
ncbi:hypothetical protein ACI7YT_12500 [Microbacterium sp. M]|uniref:hypothetical protein n=1 Tax=Microbacterium sp. M TaxID=3377125 RepID=UPI00386B9598